MKKIKAYFYALPSGKKPVREWLLDLEKSERECIGKDILKVEFGFPIGMPYCRPLGDGLWEVRSSLPTKKEARVIFALIGQDMVLLHGFIKKTQKTPQTDLELARKRLKEIENG